MEADGKKIIEPEGDIVNMGPGDVRIKEALVNMGADFTQVSTLGARRVCYFGRGNISIINGTIYVNGKQVVDDGSPGFYYCDENANMIRVDASTSSHRGKRPNDECAPTAQKRAKTETQPAPTETKSDDVTDLPVILEGEECTICFEPYRRAEDMKFLPCAHFFHRRCVENWQAIDNTCPLCRLNAVTGEKA